MSEVLKDTNLSPDGCMSPEKPNSVLGRINRIRRLSGIEAGILKMTGTFAEFRQGLGGHTVFNKKSFDQFKQKAEDKPKK